MFLFFISYSILGTFSSSIINVAGVAIPKGQGQTIIKTVINDNKFMTKIPMTKIPMTKYHTGNVATDIDTTEGTNYNKM